MNLVLRNTDSYRALECFKDRIGLAADNLLRIVVFQSKDGAEYFIKGESTDNYYSCGEDEKLRLEVARWRSALSAVLEEPPDPRSLQLMSRTLYNVYMAHNPREVQEQVVARALRMVMLFDAPDGRYRGGAESQRAIPQRFAG